MSKILLLEDDFSLADGLRFALEKQGYEVDERRTIAEAKVAWNSGIFDLLILDVSLPDGSGFDFCKSVHQSSDVPIIFLTASDEETNVIMGLDIGGDDYVRLSCYIPLFLRCVALAGSGACRDCGILCSVRRGRYPGTD